jgi:aldose 1-epimerase
MTASTPAAEASAPTQLQSTLFGHLPDGRAVFAHTLQRGALRLTALDLGGIVSALWVPDAAGRLANVVLGFEHLQDYATRNPHFGVLVGRCGNRIAHGRFTLDGQTHQLDCNDGPHSLHGGRGGFGQRLWRAEVEDGGPALGAVLALHLRSEDGDQGYPGALDVCVRYSLPDAHTWAVDYQARSDRATLVNLTQHSYFNLAGRGTVHGHRLTLPASTFDAVAPGLIPQGRCPVDDTPFDFRQPVAVGARLPQAHPQLAVAGGYDHHWWLDRPVPLGSDTLALTAHLHCPDSGRDLQLFTDQPGLQFYSGNFLDGSLPAPGGGGHRRGAGLCLEPQHAPNAINRGGEAGVVAPVLRPGVVWRSRSCYVFGRPLAAQWPA